MTSHRDSSGEGNGAAPLAFATCSITGDEVAPDFWTKYFSVEPEICVQKGKPFRTPSGRMSTQPGRTGVWGSSTKHALHEDDLSSHLRYLISRLGLPRTDLPKLLQEAGVRMRFLCFWSNYSGDRTPIIEPDLRDIIESSGATIEIDEYPQMHTIVDHLGGERDVWV
jgi:hypothetical protein